VTAIRTESSPPRARSANCRSLWTKAPLPRWAPSPPMAIRKSATSLPML
jgi:hypothetical protein